MTLSTDFCLHCNYPSAMHKGNICLSGQTRFVSGGEQVPMALYTFPIRGVINVNAKSPADALEYINSRIGHAFRAPYEALIPGPEVAASKYWLTVSELELGDELRTQNVMPDDETHEVVYY